MAPSTKATTAVMIITGGGSGIGRGLAHHFAGRCATPMKVLIVGRRKEKLTETKKLCAMPDNIYPIVADVSTPEGRQDVTDEVREFVALLQKDAGTKQAQLKYVIHNAGILGKVANAKKIDLETWRRTFAINVEAPFFLTQSLLPQLSKGSRILHISSGAAHSPLAGWSTYCTSKAALHMMYKVLNLELKSDGISVGSLKPGVVASAMQDEIRQAKAEDFPKLDWFKKLKKNERVSKKGKLNSPSAPKSNGLDSAENVAHFVDFVLMTTDDEEYSEKDWDIRHEEHHRRWVV